MVGGGGGLRPSGEAGWVSLLGMGALSIPGQQGEGEGSAPEAELSA